MIQLSNPVKGAKLYRYPAGSLAQIFGENPDLYKPATGDNGHPGWDIIGAYGSPLLAACDGMVIVTKHADTLGGNEIGILAWDGSITIVYAHCEKILVEAGDQVKAGDTIGTMGNSGYVVSAGIPYWGGSNPDKKGTHCHFGVRELWKTGTPKTYSDLGITVHIKNYTNGYNGYVSPLPYFQDELINQGKNLIQRIWDYLNKGR